MATTDFPDDDRTRIDGEPDDRFRMGMYHLGLGRSALDAGLTEEARDVLARAVADLKAAAGPEHHRTVEAREHLETAETQLATGDDSEVPKPVSGFAGDR